jgi:anti-sigma factor RsiW
MNEHRRIRERLVAFLDGELPSDVAASVRAHCATCASCDVELAELRAVRSSLAADAAAVPSAPLWSAVRARRDATSPRPLSWGLVLRTSGLGFAGLLLGLAIGGANAPAETEPSLWAELGSALSEGSSLADEYLGQLDASAEGSR